MIISFFNHKGGVGKTTTVYNLAFTLADSGKNVLVLDADPQMNLTAYMYGLSNATSYSVDDPNLFNPSSWIDHVQKYLPLSSEITKNIAMPTTHNSEEKNQIIFTRSDVVHGSLSLLAGSIDLSTIDLDLSNVLKTRNSLTASIVANMQKNIRNLLKDYDYILCDTSPSASSMLNALIVVSSDYLITPVSPTFFSLQALDNMRDVIKSWIDIFHDFAKTSNTIGVEISFKYLGMIIQSAKRYNTESKKFSDQTLEWIDTLNSRVKELQKFVFGYSCGLTEEQFNNIFDNRKPFIIEEFVDFTPVIRKTAEDNGIPIIRVTQDLLQKQKNNTVQYRESLIQTQTSYNNLSQYLQLLKQKNIS